MGPGQEKNTKEAMATLAAAQLGTAKSAARYLGAMLTHDGSPKETVDLRVRKTKEAFYSVGMMWKRMKQMRIKKTYSGGWSRTLCSRDSKRRYLGDVIISIWMHVWSRWRGRRWDIEECGSMRREFEGSIAAKRYEG